MDHAGNVEKAILAEMKKPASGLIDRVTRNNQIILHNFSQAIERQCECQLPGCRKSFPMTLIPNQVLYPKFCEDHRTDFRRENFLRRLAARPETYRFESVKVFFPPEKFAPPSPDFLADLPTDPELP